MLKESTEAFRCSRLGGIAKIEVGLAEIRINGQVVKSVPAKFGCANRYECGVANSKAGTFDWKSCVHPYARRAG